MEDRYDDDCLEREEEEEIATLIPSSCSDFERKSYLRSAKEMKRKNSLKNVSIAVILATSLVVLLGVIMYRSVGQSRTAGPTITALASSSITESDLSNATVSDHITSSLTPQAEGVGNLTTPPITTPPITTPPITAEPSERKESVRVVKTFSSGSGDHTSNDVITSTWNVHFSKTNTAKSGSKSKDDVNKVDVILTAGPDRAPCYLNGTCIYRAYLDGPAKLGTYLHYDDTRNATYAASFPIHEPGHYRLLVLLESVRNTSETTDGDFMANAVCGEIGEYICMGERVSHSQAAIQVSFEADDDDDDDPLPRCEYRAIDLQRDRFEWVSGEILANKHGLDHTTTGLCPPELMPPGGVNAPEAKNRTEIFERKYKKKYWILPNQEFVWHPRTCRQPWISRQTVLDEMALQPADDNGRSLAVPTSPSLIIGVLGTSRIRDLTRVLKHFLQAGEETSLIEVQFSFLTVYSNKIKTVGHRVTSAFAHGLKDVCPPISSFANHIGPLPRVVILISHGVWEASYHNGVGDHNPKVKFRFQENADNTIRIVKEQCAGRNFKIVLMTNPVTQVWDGRVEDPYTTSGSPRLSAKLYVSGENNALRNARVNVANYAWKKAAADDPDLSIVDGEAISFPRYDTVMDNVHYHLKYYPQYGNEVTMTFVQLFLAAMLQAFDE